MTAAIVNNYIVVVLVRQGPLGQSNTDHMHMLGL